MLAALLMTCGQMTDVAGINSGALAAKAAVSENILTATAYPIYVKGIVSSTLTSADTSVTSVGAGLAGAKLIVNGVEYVSDNNGYFSFVIKEPKGNLEVILKGYAYYQKPLSAFSGNDLFIRIKLKPADIIKVIDPARIGGNTVVAPNGASVTIPQLAGLGEPLIVGLTTYEVNTDDVLNAPGDFTALDLNGEETVLVSAGMMDVLLLGAYSGKRYTLDGLGVFAAQIPVTGTINPLLAEIPLWTFSSQAGMWVQNPLVPAVPVKEVVKTVPIKTNTVTTLNADYKVGTTTCLEGIILSASDGMYCIDLIAAGFARTFYTSNEGEFKILNVPANTAMIVRVTNTLTGEIIEYVIMTNDGTGDCTDVGTFMFS